MKILLFFIAIIGILCHEVFAQFTKEKKNFFSSVNFKCLTLINKMKKYPTDAKYSADKLKAHFERLSEEANKIENYFETTNKSFFNSMKNAEKFFENIGQCADKSHIQKWVQQISTDFNTLTIESDLFEIWENFIEYPHDINSENFKVMCDQLAKTQNDIRNDAALKITAVLNSIHYAVEKCKNLAANYERPKLSEMISVFRDTLLIMKKSFYERELNAKIVFINEMGMKMHEAIGIAEVFQENYAAFEEFVNSENLIKDKQSKEYILNILAHKTLEKVNELKIVPQLKELIQTAKSFIGMEKMENNVSEIIKFRHNTRKEINAIIGKQKPEYNTEFEKTFYKTEMENLLAVEDITKFFNFFFLIDEMEKHLFDIKKAFKVFKKEKTDSDESLGYSDQEKTDIDESF